MSNCIRPDGRRQVKCKARTPVDGSQGLFSLLDVPTLPGAGESPRPAGGLPAAEGGGRLEQVTINGTYAEVVAGLGGYTSAGIVERLIVTGCKCRSWACPECGMAYWGRFRARTLGAGLGKIFARAALFTLTLDRKHFVDLAAVAGLSEEKAAEFAYEHVEGHGYVRRLMRLLGVKKWVKVLAFHPKNKNWVHWHIVLDLGDLMGGRLDLKRAWALWRDKFRCGGLDLAAHKHHGQGFYSAESALGYAIGYCQHQAGGVADWVYNRARLPRAYELGGECRRWLKMQNVAGLPPVDDRGEEPDCEDTEGDAVADCVRAAAAQVGTVGERVRKCGKGVQFVRELVYPDGKRYYKWVGSCSDVSLTDLFWMVRTGSIAGAAIEKVVYGETERLQLVVNGRSSDGVEALTRAANRVRGAALPGASGARGSYWEGRRESAGLLDYYSVLAERDAEAAGESFSGKGCELVSDCYAPF